MKTRFVCIALIAAMSFQFGCNPEEGRNEQRKIHDEDMPQVLQIIRRDIEAGSAGTQEAADLMARGFLVEDTAARESQIRSVLHRVRNPSSPRGTRIDSLMTFPISFMAAVGNNGIVIARDREPDPMRGMNLAEAAPVVRSALDGTAANGLNLIPGRGEEDTPAPIVLFAAPSRHRGAVTGSIVMGVSLRRLAQQMTSQLHLEHPDERRRGELIWVMFYYNDEQHHHREFPPDLLLLAPDAARRATGLADSPGGYTGQAQQYGRWYGFGVLPLPSLGEGVGAILFRSDAV